MERMREMREARERLDAPPRNVMNVQEINFYGKDPYTDIRDAAGNSRGDDWRG